MSIKAELNSPPAAEGLPLSALSPLSDIGIRGRNFKMQILDYSFSSFLSSSNSLFSTKIRAKNGYIKDYKGVMHISRLYCKQDCMDLLFTEFIS